MVRTGVAGGLLLGNENSAKHHRRSLGIIGEQHLGYD
jgi:hypothetical protein